MDLLYRRFSWWVFGLLFGLTPFLFYPLLRFFPLPFVMLGVDPIFGELFEVPKMFWIYFLTCFLLGVWALKCLVSKELTVFRSKMDIPVLLMVGVGIVSTIFSIDWFSSVFGYPTRLHGGLLSILAYGLLYWLYIWSGFTANEIRRHIWIGWVCGVVVGIYGISQAFGLDTSVWEQDVQSRVFSTVGQPNWLAAYLVGIIGIGVWLLSVTENRLGRYILWIGSLVLITGVVLTRSRSGLLGLIVLCLAIIGLVTARYVRQKRVSRWWWLVLLMPLVLLIFYRFNFGANETSRIRLAVWQGSWEVFLAHPLVGSGVETFAFAFYQYRPLELLQTSEWDLLYNKAHNEILHLMATNGSLGIIIYLVYHYKFIVLGVRSEKLRNVGKGTWKLGGVLGGWLGMMVTNLFGFSTVLIGLLGMVYLVLLDETLENVKWTIRGNVLKVMTAFLLVMSVGGLVGTSLMVMGDVSMAEAKRAQDQGDLSKVMLYQERAVRLFPINPWYRSDLGFSYAFAARTLYKQQAEAELMQELMEKATSEVDQSLRLASSNTIVWRKAAASYAELAKIDRERFAKNLIATSDQVWKMAPNDVKLRLGLVEYYRLAGEENKANDLTKELREQRAELFKE